jgi:hypothetical protein
MAMDLNTVHIQALNCNQIVILLVNRSQTVYMRNVVSKVLLIL